MHDVVRLHVMERNLMAGVDRLSGRDVHRPNRHSFADRQWAQGHGDIVVGMDAKCGWAVLPNVCHLIASKGAGGGWTDFVRNRNKCRHSVPCNGARRKIVRD